MLSRLLKEHQAKQNERKELQEKRRREAIAAATCLTEALVDHLNVGVAQAYVNQRKLDHEVKTLQVQASQFSKQTAQWISMVEGFNQALKTVEIIVDFRKHKAPLPPIILTDTPITSVDSFRFLGTTITQDLKWEPTITSVIKKAQQRMYFLRQLKKFNLPTRTMMQFYTAIIESILTSSITVWYTGATIRDKQRLQRVVRSAEKVIGCRLPSLQDLYTSRTLRRAARISADPSHPGHSLFDLLPSGRRLRSIRTRTSRHKNSFFPSAVGHMNNNHMTVPTTNT
uniref:Biogenesis of lysosome-related organelles complex 1 subunit 1 n=1 Tax=Astatotilapia calliptera TaxID=8154 RepID=A0AAX7TII9_ASTCA